VDKMNGAVPASILIQTGSQIRIDLSQAKSLFAKD
jgi:hypothetical protein